MHTISIGMRDIMMVNLQQRSRSSHFELASLVAVAGVGHTVTTVADGASNGPGVARA